MHQCGVFKGCIQTAIESRAAVTAGTPKPQDPFAAALNIWNPFIIGMTRFQWLCRERHLRDIRRVRAQRALAQRSLRKRSLWEAFIGVV